MKRVAIRLIGLASVTGFVFMALPQSSASADSCLPGEVYCMPDAVVQINSSDPCTQQNIASFYGVFSGNLCTTGSGVFSSSTQQNPDLYIPGISDVFIKLTQFAQSDASFMMTFIMNNLLSGDNVAESPILSCQDSQGAQRSACAGKSEWFIGQYALMRNIAMFVVIPMFFLMVIQSVSKGSLFMLLRGALIMLPVSVIGTVALISILQLLLNIVDDFCNYMVARSTTGLDVGTCQAWGQAYQNVGCGISNSLIDRSVGNTNPFVAFFLAIVLFGAAIATYLELLGREMGIYIMALVMPLAMAALVWARAAAITRLIIQWELAAIFAKIFMVAGLCLGLGAFAQSGGTDCTNTGAAATTCAPHAPLHLPQGTATPVAAPATTTSNEGWTTELEALAIIFTMLFAFNKAVMMTPSSVIGQKPIWDKGAIRARGQALAAIQQNIIRLQGVRNRNRKPGDNFKSQGHNPNARNRNNAHGPDGRGPIGNGPNGRGPNGRSTTDRNEVTDRNGNTAPTQTNPTAPPPPAPAPLPANARDVNSGKLISEDPNYAEGDLVVHTQKRPGESEEEVKERLHDEIDKQIEAGNLKEGKDGKLEWGDGKPNPKAAQQLEKFAAKLDGFAKTLNGEDDEKRSGFLGLLGEFNKNYKAAQKAENQRRKPSLAGATPEAQVTQSAMEEQALREAIVKSQNQHPAA